MPFPTNNAHKRSAAYFSDEDTNQDGAYYDWHRLQHVYAETPQEDGNYVSHCKEPGFHAQCSSQIGAFHVPAATGIRQETRQEQSFFVPWIEPAVSESRRYLAESGNRSNNTHRAMSDTSSSKNEIKSLPFDNDRPFPNLAENENDERFCKDVIDPHALARTESVFRPRPNHVATENHPTIPSFPAIILPMNLPTSYDSAAGDNGKVQGLHTPNEGGATSFKVYSPDKCDAMKDSGDDVSVSRRARHKTNRSSIRTPNTTNNAPYAFSIFALDNGNNVDEIPGLYTKIDRGWICTFQTFSGEVCGLTTRSRRDRLRHIGRHAKEEKELMDRGQLKIADAVAYPRQDLLEFTCPVPNCEYLLERGVPFHIKDYRIDNKKASHNKLYHPELIKRRIK